MNSRFIVSNVAEHEMIDSRTRCITPLQATGCGMIHGCLNSQRVIRAQLMVSGHEGVMSADYAGGRPLARAPCRCDTSTVLYEVQIRQAFANLLVSTSERYVAALVSIAPTKFSQERWSCDIGQKHLTNHFRPLAV